MRQEQAKASATPALINDCLQLQPNKKPQSLIKNMLAAEKFLLSKMLRAIGNPPVKIVLWNGQEIQSLTGQSPVQVHIHDRGALLKLVADPELHFGELYSAQRIEVQGSLLDFLETIYRSWPLYKQGNIIKKLLARFYDAPNNSISGSLRNISHHYDIGNDFYKLWLDKRMLYTCAYFAEPDSSLEQAQLDKMDHICRKLNLQPGDSVVEAGCGWGALALHMAKYYGVKVSAYNISKEQIAFAWQRVHDAGLSNRVSFIEDDYRNIHGQFDAFVSVGMLEHVGTDNYKALGAVIDRCLTNNGRGLIHSIGLNYPRPMDAWAERHIFPGANPPSLAQMMQIFEPYDFSVLDVENLRMHYAQTLQHWLQRYDANITQVSAMFDTEFVRAWRLYLAGSLTAFKSGGMQLFQVSFARAEQNNLPWTRQHLYTSAVVNQRECKGDLNGTL
jgi:cyclopropane-fatty-acyl-phospholipid synthase